MVVHEMSRASIVLQLLSCLFDLPVLPSMLVESQIVKAVKTFKQVHAYFDDTNATSAAQVQCTLWQTVRASISTKGWGVALQQCDRHRLCKESFNVCLA